MDYSVNVNTVKSNKESNIRGFATVVFGEAFKITNITILENKDKGSLFVSMPRYRTSDRDENNNPIFKDVCNPITAEFREELYNKILEAYDKAVRHERDNEEERGTQEEPSFSVAVTPFEREGSNIRGLARIYLGESFVISNVDILAGRDGQLFVSMPSYKTKQLDGEGRAVYNDVCYPVTKGFREKLYQEILRQYEEEKKKDREQAKDRTESGVRGRAVATKDQQLPF